MARLLLVQVINHNLMLDIVYHESRRSGRPHAGGRPSPRSWHKRRTKLQSIGELVGASRVCRRSGRRFSPEVVLDTHCKSGSHSIEQPIWLFSWLAVWSIDQRIYCQYCWLMSRIASSGLGEIPTTIKYLRIQRKAGTAVCRRVLNESPGWRVWDISRSGIKLSLDDERIAVWRETDRQDRSTVFLFYFYTGSSVEEG